MVSLEPSKSAGMAVLGQEPLGVGVVERSTPRSVARTRAARQRVWTRLGYEQDALVLAFEDGVAPPDCPAPMGAPGLPLRKSEASQLMSDAFDAWYRLYDPEAFEAQLAGLAAAGASHLVSEEFSKLQEHCQAVAAMESLFIFYDGTHQAPHPLRTFAKRFRKLESALVSAGTKRAARRLRKAHQFEALLDSLRRFQPSGPQHMRAYLNGEGHRLLAYLDQDTLGRDAYRDVRAQVAHLSHVVGLAADCARGAAGPLRAMKNYLAAVEQAFCPIDAAFAAGCSSNKSCDSRGTKIRLPRGLCAGLRKAAGLILL